MHTHYHIQLTRQALQGRVSSTALEMMITANLGQDNLRGQISHPEFHYDDNAFQDGDRYLEAQRAIVLQVISTGQDPLPAWQAFGRLSHAAQDFYAHSNYVALWLECCHKDGDTLPEQVDILEPRVLESPDMRSGRIYPLEILTLIPFLRPLARRLLPRDAHAWMNLDGPEGGHLFPLALSAARRRTAHEFHQLCRVIHHTLGPQAVQRFTALPQAEIDGETGLR